MTISTIKPTHFKPVSLQTAFLSIALVIGLYPVLGKIIAAFLKGVEVAGYSVKWGVLPTVFIAALCVFWHRREGRSWPELGFYRPKSFWKAGLLAVISVPVIYLLIAVIVGTLMGGDVISSPESSGKITVDGPSRTVSVVLTLIVMWGVAAFCEELIFRGFLLGRLANAFGGERKHWIIAVILIAILFGAAHIPAQGGYGFVLTGLAGLFLGFLYLIGKRNIWTVIIAHGLINSVSLL